MENNNDKAKKILFGKKDLPDNPEAKMNEEALKRRTPSDLAKAVSEISKKNVGAVLYRNQWICAIDNYCKEAGISPADLIEFHKRQTELWNTYFTEFKESRIT